MGRSGLVIARVLLALWLVGMPKFLASPAPPPCPCRSWASPCACTASRRTSSRPLAAPMCTMGWWVACVTVPRLQRLRHCHFLAPARPRAASPRQHKLAALARTSAVLIHPPGGNLFCSTTWCPGGTCRARSRRWCTSSCCAAAPTRAPCSPRYAWGQGKEDPVSAARCYCHAWVDGRGREAVAGLLGSPSVSHTAWEAPKFRLLLACACPPVAPSRSAWSGARSRRRRPWCPGTGRAWSTWTSPVSAACCQLPALPACWAEGRAPFGDGLRVLALLARIRCWQCACCATPCPHTRRRPAPLLCLLAGGQEGKERPIAAVDDTWLAHGNDHQPQGDLPPCTSETPAVAATEGWGRCSGWPAHACDFCAWPCTGMRLAADPPRPLLCVCPLCRPAACGG